jgi:hypothetical protein
MPRWAVETPAEKITPRQVLGEENADVRRELIRKVGIERMLNALPHSLLDSQTNYELYSVNLGQGAKSAKYLKMTNPSVGCYHLEGVAPECDTVDSALRWRNSQWFAEAEALT